MSLNWNVKKVKGHEDLCWRPRPSTGNQPNPRCPGGELVYEQHYVTKTLVFLTIDIGIPTITEDNAAEFHRRALLNAELFGLPIYETINGKRITRTVTLEEVEAHVGLYTNSRSLTTRSFNAKVKKERKRQEPGPIFPEGCSPEELAEANK